MYGVDTIDWYDLDGERRHEGRRLGIFFGEIGVKHVSPLDAEDLLVRLLYFLGGGIRGNSVARTPESGATEISSNRGTSGSCSLGLERENLGDCAAVGLGSIGESAFPLV